MITREEIIEVCNKLGLTEFSVPNLEDYIAWKFSNNIFKMPTSSTIVILSRNPHDKVTGNRLYFYDRLKYSKEEGFCLQSEDEFNSYCTIDGKNYAEMYDKESFETAIKNVIKKIKTTEMNFKLENIQKDFK